MTRLVFCVASGPSAAATQAVQGVKVMTVWWGDGITPQETEDNTPYEDVLSGFYAAITNRPYMDGPSESDFAGYSLTSKYRLIQDVGSTSPRLISTGDIHDWLSRSIAAHKLPAPDEDTVYMLYFPPTVVVETYGTGGAWRRMSWWRPT
jgi:hypothetical protein